MRMILLWLPLLVASTPSMSAGTTVSALNSPSVVGSHATVCGRIFSQRYHGDMAGQPVILHLGDAYPNHSFAVRVNGADRGKFEPEVETRVGAMTCVTGDVVQHGHSAPEMTITSPESMIVM
jgi:hypothetical protein